MEKLAAMKPRFLRFPGGNYVEGNTLWERFDWKATIGPLPFRSGHPSCWGYRSTDGMGLLEFMGWCEDLDAQPVLAVFAGYSLRQQNVEPGPLLEPYVHDALDEIEFLTGDAKKTYWGSLRAAMAIQSLSNSPTWKSATRIPSTSPAATTAALPSSTTPSRPNTRVCN